MKAFHKNIVEGNVANETVPPSVRSNLTCVLGRTAGRESRLVTWDEILKADKKIDAKLEGLKE
jgi:hypothetical protein